MILKYRFIHHVVALLLGTLSGISVIALTNTPITEPETVNLLLPGLSFGVFFAIYLAVFSKYRKGHALRIIAVICGSIITYPISYLAFIFFIVTIPAPILGVLSTGFIGGCIIAILNLLIQPLSKKAILICGLVGMIAGLTLLMRNTIALYIVWHSSMFLTLSFFVPRPRSVN